MQFDVARKQGVLRRAVPVLSVRSLQRGVHALLQGPRPRGRAQGRMWDLIVGDGSLAAQHARARCEQCC